MVEFFYHATACNATHGIAKALCPSIRLSVRLSNACIMRVHCDKTKQFVPAFL